MDLIHVGAALLSAFLHASWNAAIKASREPSRAMTAQMLIGAVLVVPALLVTGLPARASWPWLVGSTLINIATVRALLRAYSFGGFGIVYPMVRALAVLMVVPMAAAIAGDRIGPYALAGVMVIILSLAALAYDATRGKALSPKALGWTLAAGLGTAAYVLCDAQGVRASGSPLAYGFTASITNAAAMCWHQRHVGAPWRQLDGQWVVAAPAALASMVSYLLILWVWSNAPIAAASALRDTSAVFAILIAVTWLKEPFTPTRIAAVLLAAAAVPLLRLG